MSAQDLVTQVRAALGRVQASDEAYLGLLARRLEHLERLVHGGAVEPWRDTHAERALGRRFVRSREGTWNDGDENLVRAWLDPWPSKRAEADAQAWARGMLTAATRLAEIEARAETLWFFLWELEGRWALLEGRG